MRVAIVGHGASAEGARLGSAIDACGLVVRMHDCHWQEAEDYGQRWDIGILPGPWRGQWERTRNGTPSEGWWCYTLKKHAAPESVGGAKVLAKVDLSHTRALLLRPGMVRAAPTRGLAAALMAIEIARPETIVLIGFDRLWRGISDCTPYTKAQAQADPEIAADNARMLRGFICGPHHFGAERQMLIRCASEAGVNLVFPPHQEIPA